MNTFLYFLSLCLIIGISTLFLVEYKFKRWRCNEGQCEKVIGGDFSSLLECQNTCYSQPSSIINTQNNSYDLY